LGVFWLLVPLLVSADQFTGTVVGISDGDTINVLREGKAVKVRLHGVDTPEKAQAFGTQARQFTSDMVFQQTVTVIVQDTDRYGRLVGEVLFRPVHPDARCPIIKGALVPMAYAYVSISRLCELVEPAKA
jgi:endonuclease YncB( thermonuclease family)